MIIWLYQYVHCEGSKLCMYVYFICKRIHTYNITQKLYILYYIIQRWDTSSPHKLTCSLSSSLVRRQIYSVTFHLVLSYANHQNDVIMSVSIETELVISGECFILGSGYCTRPTSFNMWEAFLVYTSLQSHVHRYFHRTCLGHFMSIILQYHVKSTLYSVGNAMILSSLEVLWENKSDLFFIFYFKFLIWIFLMFFFVV